jgi:hypothetical protein
MLGKVAVVYIVGVDEFPAVSECLSEDLGRGD